MKNRAAFSLLYDFGEAVAVWAYFPLGWAATLVTTVTPFQDSHLIPKIPTIPKIEEMALTLVQMLH